MQVRSTGPVDQITRQPIKGRKRGGGIRFGEMERDSMLAHGAAYLLHDRLHTCSDYHIADVCSICGSILTTHYQPQRRIVRDIGGLPPVKAPKKVVCHACQTSKGIETVAMPYVFRYLAAELAAMNIKMTLHLNDGAWHLLQFEQRIFLHDQVLAQFRPPSGVQAVDRNQGHGFVQFMMDEEFEQLLYLELERYEWRPCTCIHTSIDNFFLFFTSIFNRGDLIIHSVVIFCDLKLIIMKRLVPSPQATVYFLHFPSLPQFTRIGIATTLCS